MRFLLFFLFLDLFSIGSYAQGNFEISGTVKNMKGEVVEAATVFINGSKKITKTDEKGLFIFKTVSPGTYQIVINMIGYASIKENVVLQDKAISLELALVEKGIVLNEVTIGNNSQRASQIKTFLKKFLGESDNAKSCSLLNPELLDFSTRQTLLDATTSDFLIIENKNLGYRIKYLLRNFRFNSGTGVTSYDGESLFENLDGTEDQQAVWKKNRLFAYQGSFMHYLRSLYLNTTRNEGFQTHNITTRMEPLVLDPVPLDMEQFLFTIDSNFVELKFSQRLYVYYDVKKTALKDLEDSQENIKKIMDATGSVMQLYLENAVLDKKGSYVDYRSFLLKGYWSSKRLGDQLPFEYQPGD
ncbi:MAG: carboxypeptidase-like regulatory domain-containing protein [Bacteroidota bacterium]